MHNILIIEDETPARNKLKRFIEKADIDSNIIGELETTSEVRSFLDTQKNIDIIFSDIELRDGNVFDVYKEASIECPIIFATAYDEFIMNAFETNGIEYLLKPFTFDRFLKSWNKFILLKGDTQKQHIDLMKTFSSILQTNSDEESYKNKFSIKSSNAIYFLMVDDIVYIQADGGLIFAYDRNNKRHIMSQTSLSDIESLLNPRSFFRINRSEIVHMSFVEKLERYTKNTLAVYLNQGAHILYTSQSRTSDFNTWLGV